MTSDLKHEPLISLQESPERVIATDYPGLCLQVMWDTFYVHKPGEFLTLCSGIPSIYLPAPWQKAEPFRPPAQFQSSMQEFKTLVECYETTLSAVTRNKPLGQFHRPLERCTRATILGLGKARRGDLKGAFGWWEKARDQWDEAEDALRSAPAIPGALRPGDVSMIREMQSGFLAAADCAWPPRLAP
jgi:hypothetical protein